MTGNILFFFGSQKTFVIESADAVLKELLEIFMLLSGDIQLQLFAGYNLRVIKKLRLLVVCKKLAMFFKLIGLRQ